MDLIQKMSIDYEIPFIIVLTQCMVDEECDLEREISENKVGICKKRILAKEYSTRGGKIPAYGVQELLEMSAKEYKGQKIDILEKKLIDLEEKRKIRVKLIENRGKECIERYKRKAAKIGVLPIGCIPIVHGICIKMISELNKIGGLPSEKNLAEEIFLDAIVGLELDSEKTRKSIKAIKEIIASKAGVEDKYDRVHVIWYCINSGSNRYQVCLKLLRK